MSRNITQTRQEEKEKRKKKWRTLINLIKKEGRQKRTTPITRMKISEHEWDILMAEYRHHIGDIGDNRNCKRKQPTTIT
mgnify:CR=1 FL=1